MQQQHKTQDTQTTRHTQVQKNEKLGSLMFAITLYYTYIYKCSARDPSVESLINALDKAPNVNGLSSAIVQVVSFREDGQKSPKHGPFPPMRCYLPRNLRRSTNPLIGFAIHVITMLQSSYISASSSLIPTPDTMHILIANQSSFYG